ncbi:MAG: hypothetical protein JNM86_13315 [Phycisphaerae bacterium]|nr:hypothetical protein [Phycisphaerae bacterium]
MFEAMNLRLSFRTIAVGLLSLLTATIVQADTTSRQPSVLFLFHNNYSTDVLNKLRSTGVFQAADLFHVQTASPSLALLMKYDAVLVSDGGYQDAAAIGNTLADYVDAGGGVVLMANACVGAVVDNQSPRGRWLPGYSVLAPGNGFYGQGNQYLDLSTITDSNHPVFIGVQSFDGGSEPGMTHNANVVPGAKILAKWTNGNVFVAEGPLPGRIDLNFFPLSQESYSWYWRTLTDGVKLMTNSLVCVMRPRVMLVAADDSISIADVRSKLRATERLGIVDTLDASTSTPSLTQLKGYDAVVVWGRLNFQNSAALGNVLADFADLGRGVIVAASSESEFSADRRLGGRWLSGGYEIIPSSTTVSSGANSLGSIPYANHPIVSAVSEFHTDSNALQAGGLPSNCFAAARWTDGTPLAALSHARFNRVDLAFYPPSSDAPHGRWHGDGAQLLANSVICSIKPYVACIASDAANMNDVADKLASSRRFSAVASFDATAATPTEDELAPFNSVLTWSSSPFGDSAAFGNRLASYVDSGGAVVTAMMANIGGPFDAAYRPGGRWTSEGFDILPEDSLPGLKSGTPAFLSTSQKPGPLNYFLRKLFGGTQSLRPDTVTAMRGRSVLSWHDGRLLGAVHNFRKRIDLGIYPPSSATSASGWHRYTDGTQLLANALEGATRMLPCSGDLNGDSLVDDTDFLLFVRAYDTLLDPTGDLNGDGLTSDSDFEVFLTTYTALQCP